MRLRFTIRDLLWLTVVAALAVGWWVDHRRLSEYANNWEKRFVHPSPMPGPLKVIPPAPQ